MCVDTTIIYKNLKRIILTSKPEEAPGTSRKRKSMKKKNPTNEDSSDSDSDGVFYDSDDDDEQDYCWENFCKVKHGRFSP